MELSSRFVASLLASIFGPSFYDDPRFGRGDLGHRVLIDLASGPQPEPWREVALNPQPLPPKARYALAVADAHLHDLLTLDRAGALLGGEVQQRALDRTLRTVAELDELCPRWPRWPKGWPRPKNPWEQEEMSSIELFLFGTRVLAAADQFEDTGLQDALNRLGEKALGFSQRGLRG